MAYRLLSAKSSGASTGPTRISAVGSGPPAAAAATVDKVARTIRSSGQLARQTIATGQSAPYAGVRSATTVSSAWIDRWIASVAPVAAKTVRLSAGGIVLAR